MRIGRRSKLIHGGSILYFMPRRALFQTIPPCLPGCARVCDAIVLGNDKQRARGERFFIDPWENERKAACGGGDATLIISVLSSTGCYDLRSNRQMNL